MVLNGEYQGLYILLEKIKRTKNRLYTSKLKEDDIAGEELTGGYIFEIAGQHDDFGFARRLRYPDFDEVQPERLVYIGKYDDDFRRAMASFSTDNPAELYNVVLKECVESPDFQGRGKYRPTLCTTRRLFHQTYYDSWINRGRHKISQFS